MPPPSPNNDLEEMLHRALRGELTEDEIQCLGRLADSLEHLCDSIEVLMAFLDEDEIDFPTEDDTSSKSAMKEESAFRVESDYAAAGEPFGPSRQARGIWRLFRQATTVN